MALHLSLVGLPSLPPLIQPVVAFSSETVGSSGYLMWARRRRGRSRGRATDVTIRRCKIKASLEVAAPVVGQVTEVNKDTFWPLVKAAASKTVVLDMYTQWCGPCKVMAPKFQKLSQEYEDVIFLKLDCNQENKALAKELGIKVVPTFKILKDCKVMKEVTGAKFDDLVVAIEAIRSS